MGSFPPPTANEIVHQPGDAPFEPPHRRRSRRPLWIVFALIALIAAIAGGLFLAHEIGEDENVTTTDDSTAGAPAASDEASRSTATTAAATGSSSPDGLPPPAASTSFASGPVASTAPTNANAAPATPPRASTVVPAPGTDLSALTITHVIVSPGKSGGNPVDGAVPVLPGVVPTFPSSTDYVCIFWNASGMPNDVPNGIIWTLDGHVVGSLDDTTFRWTAGSTVRPNWCVPSRPSGLDDGHHRVEYYVAGERKFVAEFVIGD
jgi:hypothetical protein